MGGEGSLDSGRGREGLWFMGRDLPWCLSSFSHGGTLGPRGFLVHLAQPSWQKQWEAGGWGFCLVVEVVLVCDGAG